MGSRIVDFQAYIERRSMPIPWTGCWLWDGCVQKQGYGLLELLHKRLLAHRVSYQAFNGVIPNGLHILHKCDVPSCVNPAHLYAGTDQDNVNDRERRDRGRKTGNPLALFCKYGHSTSEPGSRTKNRSCMVCSKAFWKQRKRNRRRVKS